MLKIHEGQCGMCAHFGEDHRQDQTLVQIRISGQAQEDMIESCGHPQHADLNLKVTPISGCSGYVPAKVA